LRIYVNVWPVLILIYFSMYYYGIRTREFYVPLDTW